MSSQRTDAWLLGGVAAAFAIAMLGTTLPTPLYPIYQAQYGFSDLIITLIFAIYAIGVMGALLVAGIWSDQLGRRPILLAGLAFAAVSTLFFIGSTDLTLLLVGRLLSGVAAGIFTGTATVAVLELAPSAWQPKAVLIATAANMGGLGLGPMLAGALAEYGPLPLRLPYIVYMGLVGLAFYAIWRAPETVERARQPRLTIRKPSVPPQTRSVFIPAAVAGFAAFAVMGLFTAMIPNFIGQVLDKNNVAVMGAVVLLFFLASMAGQMGQPHIRQRWQLPGGCLGMIAGMACLLAALLAQALLWLLLAAVVAGASHGIVFRASLGEITRASPAQNRAGVTSTFFVVAYLGLALPVVGLGILGWLLSLVTAGIIFAVAVALLALAVVIRRLAGRQQPNQPQN